MRKPSHQLCDEQDYRGIVSTLTATYAMIIVEKEQKRPSLSRV